MSFRGAADTRSRRRRSGGQSLVEFALVIPVFLAILFGILDFGFMLYSRITLINATREGARFAVVQADNTTAIDEQLNSQSGPIRANVPGLINTSPDLAITITCVPESGATPCDYTASNGTRDAQTGDSVRVTTNYTYHSFFARFIGATVPLGTSVTMVIE
jgi:Flp pilus assembly protein TadG